MATNKQRLFAVTALAAAAALGLTGYTVTNNKIIWQYLGQVGTPTYGNLPYDTGDGEPKHSAYTTNLENLPIPDLPKTLLSRIAVMLPEALNINNNTRVSLGSDEQTNLVLKAGLESDIYVSFLSEGAGYRNSVGYFTYDPANPPKSPADVKSELILFPNASQDNETPFKVATSSKASTVKFHVSTGSKPVGVGFFIVADGWNGSRDLRLAGGQNASGTTRTPGVDENSSRKIYYSLKALNNLEPDDDRNLRQHAILLNEEMVAGRNGAPAFQRLVLGFEDMLRTGGDHDFNDVLLAVHVTPAGPENITNLAKISNIVADNKDSDGDGVKDTSSNSKDPIDAYPLDPTAASYKDYPSSTGWATLAYEDNWPNEGDYDLNDMVVRYRSREIKHAAGKVSRLEMNLRLDARGAGFRNGFALALPGILPDDVESATLTTINTNNQASEQTIAPLDKSIHKQAVFEIFKDAYALQASQSDSNCKSLGFYNAAAGCPIGGFTEFKLVVKMKTKTSGSLTDRSPLYAGSFPAVPYDPFLFRTEKPGIEVHLPGKKPSARADASLFNTGVDASKLGTSYTYMTSKGLPWALNIPALWDYPSEAVRVEAAYTGFVSWAASGGSKSQTWYVTPSDKSAPTYGKTDKASLQAAKTFRNGR